MSETWKFIGHCFDGEKFEINGLNVWEHNWHETGQKTQIKDPLWNQDFEFPIYTMEDEGKTVIFATGEFSNNVWGFFQKQDD